MAAAQRSVTESVILTNAAPLPRLLEVDFILFCFLLSYKSGEGSTRQVYFTSITFSVISEIAFRPRQILCRKGQECSRKGIARRLLCGAVLAMSEAGRHG